MRVEDFDIEIERLETHLIDLKQSRNALLPICRLPNEVVLRVAKLLRGWNPEFESRSTLNAWMNVDVGHRNDGTFGSADEDDGDSNNDLDGGNEAGTNVPSFDAKKPDPQKRLAVPHWDTHRGWTSIFRTCTLFRSMLWSSRGQDMWSYIRFSSRTDTIRHYICQSGTQSLILDLEYGCDANYKLASELFPRARAARLEPYILSNGIPIISEALRRSAPALQELQVRSQPSVLGKITVGQYKVDGTFLGGQATRLHSLYMESAHIHHVFPSFPALQHLHLRESYVSDTLQALLRLLSTAPSLETLVLDILKTVNDDTDAIVNISKPLPMPHLKSLTINGSLWSVYELLLFMPDPSLLLSININTAGDDKSMLLLTIARASSRLTALDVRTKISQRISSFWVARAGEGFIPNSGVLELGTSSLELKLHCGSDTASSVRLDYTTVYALDTNDALLTAVGTVHVRWMRRKANTHDAELLLKMHMPNIQHLTIFADSNTEEADMQRFEAWLSTRTTAEHSIQSIKF
jgi:hypothetical protein